MGKIAFVFSGQGDQFPGMGKSRPSNLPFEIAVSKSDFSIISISPGVGNAYIPTVVESS